MTTQANVFFVAYYRQSLNKQTTRPGFFVTYYGQPLNKQMAKPSFFVACYGQPPNKQTNEGSNATCNILTQLMPTNGMFPLLMATYDHQLLT